MNFADWGKESGVGTNLKSPRIDRAHRLQAVRQFIEDNLHRDNLTPAAVAQALGISLRQLHMLFEPTGQSFSRYLLTRRLEAARAELASHPDPPRERGRARLRHQELDGVLPRVRAGLRHEPDRVPHVSVPGLIRQILPQNRALTAMVSTSRSRALL